MSRLFFPNNSSSWAFDWKAILQTGDKRYLLLVKDKNDIVGVEIEKEQQHFIGFHRVVVKVDDDDIVITKENESSRPVTYVVVTKTNAYSNTMKRFLDENPELLNDKSYFDKYKAIRNNVKEEFLKFENNVVLFDTWKFDEDFHAGKVPPRFLIDVMKNILYVIDFSNPGLEHDEEHLAETIQNADVIFPTIDSMEPTDENVQSLMYLIRWFLMVYAFEFETNKIKWGIDNKKIEYHHHQKTLKEKPKPKVQAKTDKIKKMKSCVKNVNPRLVQQRDNLKARIAKYDETLAKQKETIKKLEEKL